MSCLNCKNYKKLDNYSCAYFENKISKTFPNWIEDFRKGKLRFKSCGFFKPQ
ncbi:hypothetical protein Ferp_0342 [Ferroglobus placidus DSM 10642]|uniref:Uncharacterized protein n=1 Tax=Ferroglobus placidus (strain DSM 10642 / AEDII12DO) TaxID=589924 RepID=D3S2J1_FERPA|nr:hypothetical protein [Ferroglobus placidus]ADC64521.1 hypothetical protein Ferp_0342 [Ferroglobus placidus DSM 10642]